MNTTATKEAPATKVITGLARLSYVHVWEPSAVNDEGEKKYSVSLIIPKSDKATIEKIKAAIEVAKEAGKTKFGKVATGFENPLRDGDIERPEDDAYANSWFINAKAKTKPGIVNASAEPIMNQDEVYSGCYGRASITFYPYGQGGKKDAKALGGVAAGLNHIMKVKDGELLGGRNTAEADFAEVLGADDDLM